MENKIPSKVAVQQLGEYLVSSKLCRMDFTVSFTPRNFPDIDIIAADRSLRTVLVQVKTIHESRSKVWQLNADRFLDIAIVKGSDDRLKQEINGKRTLANTRIIWVFVKLHKDEDDEFFVCLISDVQEICYKSYSLHLEKVGGTKRDNPEAKHFTVSVAEIESYRNRWELFSV